MPMLRIEKQTLGQWQAVATALTAATIDVTNQSRKAEKKAKEMLLLLIGHLRVLNMIVEQLRLEDERNQRLALEVEALSTLEIRKDAAGALDVAVTAAMKEAEVTYFKAEYFHVVRSLVLMPEASKNQLRAAFDTFETAKLEQAMKGKVISAAKKSKLREFLSKAISLRAEIARLYGYLVPSEKLVTPTEAVQLAPSAPVEQVVAPPMETRAPVEMATARQIGIR